MLKKVHSYLRKYVHCYLPFTQYHKLRHTQYVIDICEDAYFTISAACTRIERKFGYGSQKPKAHARDADKINFELLQVLREEKSVIHKAVDKARDQIFLFECDIMDDLEEV